LEAVYPFLAKPQPEIRGLTKIVPLEIITEMVSDRDDTLIWAVQHEVCRIHIVRLVLFESVAVASHQLGVPTDEKFVTVEVSTAHHVCLRPVTLRAKDYDVVELAVFWVPFQEILIDRVQYPDVARVVARISRDEDLPGDKLPRMNPVFCLINYCLK
jgi:hypothetical protein